MGRRIPLPDPKVPRTWAQQMALEKVSDMIYRSTAGAPYGGNFVKLKDGSSRPRAFGGHVYAQATYAASKTVPSDFSIHSVTGYFTVLGLADEPFTYKIRVIRDGNNYIVRQVDVVQEDGEKIIFSSICSFKKSEPTFLNVSVPKDLNKKWNELLKGKKVKDLPILSNYKDFREAYAKQIACITTIFPGMLTSILPFEAFHKSQKPVFRQCFYIYSTVDEEESSDPHLDAAAHLYHSDRESVWSVLRQYEILDVMDSAASLSHTVIFHTPLDQIQFKKNGEKQWYYLETGSKRISDGRVLHKGRIYDVDGNHLITTMQDGAIRLKWKDEEEKLQRQKAMMSEPKL